MSDAVSERPAPPRDGLVRAQPSGIEVHDDPSTDGRIGTLTGHFSVFDVWYEVDSAWEGHFLERIAPGAFADTFAQDRERMRVTFNHGKDPQLGDKVLGPIAELEEDEHGARYVVPLLDTTYNRDLLPGIKAGLYGSSFRFNVQEEDFVRSPGRSRHNPEGIPERTVTRARVGEFGPVTFPASPSATAALRSLTDLYRPASGGSPAEPEPERKDPVSTPVVTEPQPEQPVTGAAIHPAQRPARIAELRSQAEVFARSHTGSLSREEQRAWDEITSEMSRLEADERAYQERKRWVADRAATVIAPAPEPQRAGGRVEGPPLVNVARQRVQDIYSFAETRAASRDVADERQLLRDNAMRSLESKTFPHPLGDADESRKRIADLLDHKDSADRDLARRIMITGNPGYEQAFMSSVRMMDATPINQYLTRYAALDVVGTTTTGGYSVPYVFDPTLIHTGAHTNINPFRVVCRVETIVGGNKWQGVSVGNVLAAYDGESDAVTEGGPTFGNPSMTAQRVTSHVTLSRETLQDRGDIVGEISSLISEAKDTLEENQFSVGTGATVYPLGMFVKDTFTVKETITNDTFAVADLDATEAALPIRHRRDAIWMLSRRVIRIIQGFETSNGKLFNSTLGYPAVGDIANNPGGNTGMSLLGYPVWETPSAPVTVTTDDAIVGILVSPRNYMILDRAGMDVQFIPHMFDQATGLPNGTSGILAIWRNTARSVNPDAGRQININ